MTFATISMSPLSGTVFAAAKSEITEPLGARSGTLSHADRKRQGRNSAEHGKAGEGALHVCYHRRR